MANAANWVMVSAESATTCLLTLQTPQRERGYGLLNMARVLDEPPLMAGRYVALAYDNKGIMQRY